MTTYSTDEHAPRLETAESDHTLHAGSDQEKVKIDRLSTPSFTFRFVRSQNAN